MVPRSKQQPDIACHPGLSAVRTPAHNYTLGRKKDPNTSPDGLPEVPSTKCNCTGDNSGLQSMPANEGREEAAHGNKVPRGKARATLRDFTEVDGIGRWVHCNHVRQVTPEEQEKARAEWKASPHPSNPLKLKLARREAS
ncbi:unnamed protein product [Rangifer tarandus platyrhynchus]|uniref:Uncharacterized protein n=1 Tax=Rangifer tarandus platyrhynchus TaxID=3082113 RepID=A0AC59ZA02_RANTA